MSATANSGYSFVNWTQNGSVVSTSPSYTFVLSGAVSLLANFSSPGGGFAWNPGMMSKGGIPSRTSTCATLAPGNGSTDNSARIQSALEGCPSGQVVQLSAGTFVINNLLLVHSSITLRGAGAGSTILKKTNGARARTATVVSGTNGILAPVDPGSYSYDAQPVVIVGPARWPGPDNSTSQGLTSDGQQGAKAVTVANPSGFATGQFVLLDETSGASWQSTPAGFPGQSKVWAGDRVAWNMHFPVSPGDDNANSNASGPYNSTAGTPPAAMSWFSRTDRPMNEIKEIASVSGNTIIFTSPLTIGYRTSSRSTTDPLHPDRRAIRREQRACNKRRNREPDAERWRRWCTSLRKRCLFLDEER